MKIIDLLNKIANGEEVPKKIKYRKCIFEYEEKYKDYFTKNGIIPTTFDTNGIFRNIFLDYNNFLNDEVEILEEEKKIPEIIDVISWDSCIHGVTRKEKELAIEINKTQKLLNQLIDYLKSKEKGE